jgi:hypothetical protein
MFIYVSIRYTNVGVICGYLKQINRYCGLILVIANVHKNKRIHWYMAVPSLSISQWKRTLMNNAINDAKVTWFNRPFDFWKLLLFKQILIAYQWSDDAA